MIPLVDDILLKLFADVITTQFEVIAKRFEDFESIMDNNEYTEVDKILNIIDELLNHMTVVIEEVPSIVVMTDNVIPKNINEVEQTYQEMIKEGYRATVEMMPEIIKLFSGKYKKR